MHSNKISKIDIQGNIVFKELKKLNLFDNNIANINVLKQLLFGKLEILNLGYNKIDENKNKIIISTLKSLIKYLLI